MTDRRRRRWWCWCGWAWRIRWWSTPPSSAVSLFWMPPIVCSWLKCWLSGRSWRLWFSWSRRSFYMCMQEYIVFRLDSYQKSEKFRSLQKKSILFFKIFLHLFFRLIHYEIRTQLILPHFYQIQRKLRRSESLMIYHWIIRLVNHMRTTINLTKKIPMEMMCVLPFAYI